LCFVSNGMQYEVPQFIEVEDKIFGPLTWRQFLYLGGGVGAAVVMFFMLPLIFFVIFGIPLAILASALSFYPVNNRPFSYFLEAFLTYASSPKLYLWRKEKELTYHSAQNEFKGAGVEVNMVARKSGKDISSLARQLELQAIQKQER
jgi:hypothetical protein